jgi:hypothetical protein
MKRLISAFVFLFFVASAFAQKVVNDPNAEVRTVSSFHAIELSNAFEVLLTQGGSESLAVSASEKEDMQYIITKVENGVLKISFEQKHKWMPKNRKLKAYISVKNIDALQINGACNVKIDGTLKTASLKLNLSGASKLNGKLLVDDHFIAQLSGASDMEISGAAPDMKITATGASDVKAFEFSTATCNITASGASSVRISVDRELNATLRGASSVSYKGNASIKDISTSGASSISRKS